MSKTTFKFIMMNLCFSIFSLVCISAKGESLTSLKCKESNDGKILQPILEKLDGTLNFIPKIPQENIEELKNQQLIVFELQRRGIDDKLYLQAFRSMLDMKYYQQWDYTTKLNGLKREIIELISLETSNKKIEEVIATAYYGRYRGNVNAIKLDIAIETNAKYSNFDNEFFSKNSYSSTVFKDEDYKKFGLALNGLVGIRQAFDTYMHCKLARIIEKN